MAWQKSVKKINKTLEAQRKYVIKISENTKRSVVHFPAKANLITFMLALWSNQGSEKECDKNKQMLYKIRVRFLAKANLKMFMLVLWN